ncbi:MAG: hypothetical protein ACOYNR_12470 [Blastocatellia bacterium]
MAREGAHFYALGPVEMEVLLDVLKRNKKQLMAKKGVYKVDVGYRWSQGKLTGEVALRVHVAAKKPLAELTEEEIVPREIEGFPVDVIQSNLELQARTNRYNPLVGGSETGNPHLDGVGTLGAIVFDNETGERLALSNHHVYVDSRPKEAVGEAVTQPGTRGIQGVQGQDVIGTVARSHRGLDCAVARLRSSRPASTSIIDYPGGIKGVVKPAIGMRVTKSGRTTGTTHGMIEGVSADEMTVIPVPGRWMELSAGGDSGSVWLEASSHAAVGLHFAGEASSDPRDERAWAKRIERVANQLKITLNRRVTLPQRAHLGPSLASLDGSLLLGWVSTGDLRLQLARSTDGLQFTPLPPLDEKSPNSLALAAFQGKWVLAWTGIGNNRLTLMQSVDGATWGSRVTLPEVSLSAPALTVFKGELVLAWRGIESNQINVMRSRDGVSWGQKVTLTETTTSGPALTVLGSRLLLAWREAATDRLILTRSSTARTFSDKVSFEEFTSARPCLHSHQGRAYLAWRGWEDGSLQVLDSSNATKWGNKVVLREASVDGPGLATFGPDLVWSWTGAEVQQPLQILLYDLRV